MNHVIADGPMSAARLDSGTVQKRSDAFSPKSLMYALNLSSGPLHSHAVLPLPFGPSNQTCSIPSGDVWGCSRTYYERQWHKQSMLYLAHSETERNCCLRLLSMHLPPRTQEWLQEWLIYTYTSLKLTTAKYKSVDASNLSALSCHRTSIKNLVAKW